MWTAEHEPTIIAALAYYSLHVADPSVVYDALRATSPTADWDAWIANAERLHEQIRTVQKGMIV